MIALTCQLRIAATLPGACPAEGVGAPAVEDGGGPWGYEELCIAVNDPGDSRHAELREWMCLEGGGRYDERTFDMDAVNARFAIRKVHLSGKLGSPRGCAGAPFGNSERVRRAGEYIRVLRQCVMLSIDRLQGFAVLALDGIAEFLEGGNIRIQNPFQKG